MDSLDAPAQAPTPCTAAGTESDHDPCVSRDAALVLALAGTAMPFTHTAEDQAETWLRTLSMHGNVGLVLQELGVEERPLVSRALPATESVGTPPVDDVVEQVARCATEFAIARGADCMGTADLLFALFDVHGRTMDRALYMHGLERGDVFAQLAGAGRPLPA